MNRLTDIVPGAYDESLSCLELFEDRMSGKADWKSRLYFSERYSSGFAAPGGEFTRAMHAGAARVYGGRLLAGQAVIELGAGMSAYGYRLACALGARGYVGIEAFFADCLSESIRAALTGETAIPYTIIPEDMLVTLRRIPDASVSVFAFGIEECILAGAEHRLRIERELRRVLHPAGAYLSLRSDFAIKGQITKQIRLQRKRFFEIGSVTQIFT